MDAVVVDGMRKWLLLSLLLLWLLLLDDDDDDDEDDEDEDADDWNDDEDDDVVVVVDDVFVVGRGVSNSDVGGIDNMWAILHKKETWVNNKYITKRAGDKTKVCRWIDSVCK